MCMIQNNECNSAYLSVRTVLVVRRTDTSKQARLQVLSTCTTEALGWPLASLQDLYRRKRRSADRVGYSYLAPINLQYSYSNICIMHHIQ